MRVFVGCGAPRGRNLDIPGRAKAADDHIHIGIDWLVERLLRPCLVDRPSGWWCWAAATPPWIAAGLGATPRRRADVKVVVRSGFAEMKASPWEKEDAMREGVAILNFSYAQGVQPHRREPPDRRRLREDDGDEGRTPKAAVNARPDRRTGSTLIECDDVLDRGRPGEFAFPWIETRHWASTFGKSDGLPEGRSRSPIQLEPCRMFSSAATPRSGPRTSSPRSPTATSAAISIDAFCQRPRTVEVLRPDPS